MKFNELRDLVIEENKKDAVAAGIDPESDIQATGQGHIIYPKRFFNSQVVTIAPNGAVNPRAPQYCATLEGGGLVAATITEELGEVCQPYLEHPLGPKYSQSFFKESAKVSWLRFADGSILNAADVLVLCNNRYPANQIRNATKLMIHDARVEIGLAEELEQSERQKISNEP